MSGAFWHIYRPAAVLPTRMLMDWPFLMVRIPAEECHWAQISERLYASRSFESSHRHYLDRSLGAFIIPLQVTS